MIYISNKPWADGPLELLIRDLEHLKLNTDFNNRIAIISIPKNLYLKNSHLIID